MSFHFKLLTAGPKREAPNARGGLGKQEPPTGVAVGVGTASSQEKRGGDQGSLVGRGRKQKKIANMEKDRAVGVVKSEMASVKAGFHEASTCGEFHLCIAGPTSPS